jgi:hypothetical protein
MSVDDSLTEKEAAKYLRLSLADFRDLVHFGNVEGEWYVAYEQLPPERRPKSKKHGKHFFHPAFVPMFVKAKLDAYKQSQQGTRPARRTKKQDDDEWPESIDV